MSWSCCGDSVVAVTAGASALGACWGCNENIFLGMKSGLVSDEAEVATLPMGMQAFNEAFKPGRLLLVGEDGIAVEDFLRKPIEHWVG